MIQNSDEDESESSESTDSDINVSSDEYFDADTELGILPLPGLVVTSPSVSIPPPAEGDPSDIEEDDEFTEDNDTSSEFVITSHFKRSEVTSVSTAYLLSYHFYYTGFSSLVPLIVCK